MHFLVVEIPELQAVATMTLRVAASESAFLALIMQLILIVLGTIKYKSGSFKNSIHGSEWFKFFGNSLLVKKISICHAMNYFPIIQSLQAITELLKDFGIICKLQSIGELTPAIHIE